MSSYPAACRPACVFADEGDLPAGATIAVRLPDLVSPLKNGAPLGDGERSALAVAGTEEIRTGEPVVFLKVVAVAPAAVTRKGQTSPHRQRKSRPQHQITAEQRKIPGSTAETSPPQARHPGFRRPREPATTERYKEENRPSGHQCLNPQALRRGPAGDRHWRH